MFAEKSFERNDETCEILRKTRSGALTAYYSRMLGDVIAHQNKPYNKVLKLIDSTESNKLHILGEYLCYDTEEIIEVMGEQEYEILYQNYIDTYSVYHDVEIYLLGYELKDLLKKLTKKINVPVDEVKRILGLVRRQGIINNYDQKLLTSYLQIQELKKSINFRSNALSNSHISAIIKSAKFYQVLSDEDEKLLNSFIKDIGKS